MHAPALIAALLVARILVLWGRPLDWSPELLVACVAQDAFVALLFLAMETTLHRWRAGRRVMTMLFWVIVGYVALNVAVARVLPTPLTWPMLRAAGAPIADSIRLYATTSSLMAVAMVVMTAVVARRAGQMPVAWARAGVIALVVVACAGHLAGAHVEPWGLHRNAVVTLAASALPTIRGDVRVAAAQWRHPSDDEPAPVALSALSGIAAGRNVVVIGLESVGARYLKTYGADENVMPRLDDLAAHAVIVDHAYAVSPDSIRSLFSVLCSRYPAFDTPVEHYATGPCASLASQLRGRGYHTALFHSGRFAYLGMAGVIADRGFDTLEDAGHIGGHHESSFGVDEASTVARILAWVDTVPRSARFALTYMPVAGHHPYTFAGPGAFGASNDMDRYRSALHEGDASIGVLIDGLTERGLFENTLFVVYGDHGQAFGQHPGNVGHTFYLYEENVRVPFFLAVPGAIDRAVRTDVTASLVDVTPTTLDLMGLGADARHQGQSGLRGPRRTALFFTDYGESLVGLRDGRWKFIHDLRSHQSRLFDLDRDPGEVHDLSAGEPSLVTAYARTLREWSASQKESVAVSASRAEGRPTPPDRSLWCRAIRC